MSADESSHVSGEALSTLDRYAEQSLQSQDRSEIVPEMPARLVRGGVYAIVGAIALTVALLYFGKVAVVVSAKGKIVPEGDVIALQALQGGVVHTILARAGDRLAAGAPIVKLDVQESAMDLAKLKRSHELLKVQLAAARASLAQVEGALARPDSSGGGKADAGPTQVTAIGSLENARMSLEAARQSMQRLPERRQLQAREIELTNENITLNERSRTETARVLEDEEKALARKREQLSNYRALAKKDLISSLELGAEEERYRNAESALLASRQRFAQQAIDISNQKLRKSELETKLATFDTDSRSGLRQAEMAYRQALAGLRQERQALSNRIQELESESEATAAKIKLGEGRLSLATITMPVAGTLVELRVSNPGELIPVGTVIAAVAPAGVPMAIEATVPNKDVGFVTAGLAARVKVDAYPYQQFGTAPATVQRVLPGVGADSNFRVRLRLLEDQVGGSGGGTPRLFPGLSVVAEISTSKQRLLSLLFAKDDDDKKKKKKDKD